MSLQMSVDAWSATGSALVRAGVPRPTPREDQIQVRVTAVAVGAGEFAGMAAGAVGEVIACGENARHLEGARVAIPGADPCGECELCRRGDVSLCAAPGERGVQGSVGSMVCAQARWACRLDGELALDGAAAALVCRDALWAYEACARLSTGPGDPLVVVGASALARLVVDVARSRGARPFAFASEAQAVQTGDSGALLIDGEGDGGSERDGAVALAKAAAAADFGRRPWRIVDTLGTASSRRRALHLAHPGARIALLAPTLAGTSVDAPVSLAPALDAGATLVSVRGAHPDLIPEVAALAKKGELNLSAAASIRPRDALDRLTREAIAGANSAGTTLVFEI